MLIESESGLKDGGVLTTEQLYDLIDDICVSWDVLRALSGRRDGELYKFHEDRFNHLKNVLQPYLEDLLKYGN